MFDLKLKSVRAPVWAATLIFVIAIVFGVSVNPTAAETPDETYKALGTRPEMRLLTSFMTPCSNATTTQRKAPAKARFQIFGSPSRSRNISTPGISISRPSPSRSTPREPNASNATARRRRVGFIAGKRASTAISTTSANCRTQICAHIRRAC